MPLTASSGYISLAGLNPVPAAAQSGIWLTGNAMVIFRNVMTLTLIVAALLTLFYLISGALGWIVSGGDKGRVEQARGKITSAIIGLLILAASWSIFQLVAQIALGDTIDHFRLPVLASDGSNEF